MSTGAVLFGLPPRKAIEFFQAKGLRQTYHWQEMMREEHAYAFTVAKMMDRDLLATTRQLMERMIADGRTLADFQRELVPHLQRKGWWGKVDQTDPITGDIVNVQLGSPARLETIFRTNMQSAYAVGEWDSIEANKERMPYLMYDAVDDGRTRDEHEAWDTLVYPVDHPFWRTHYPPNDYNCRCGVIQMDADDLEDEGLTVSEDFDPPTRPWTNPVDGQTEQVPEGVGPSFAYNPGQERMRALANAYMGKQAREGASIEEVGHLLRAEPVKAAYRQFVTRSLDDSIAAGRTWPVGTLSPGVLTRMDGQNVAYATGMVELTDAVVVESGVSAAQLHRVPDIMGSPDAVYYHSTRGNILYVEHIDDVNALVVTVRTNRKDEHRRRDEVSSVAVVSQALINRMVDRGSYVPW